MDLSSIFSYQNHDNIKVIVSNPLILNISIITVFCFLFYIPSKKSREDGFLNVPFTNVVRGFAILIIIIGHLCWHTVEEPKDLLLFYASGYIGVGIFLFLSAYGLTESWKKRGIKRFPAERIGKIYLPFIIINILFLYLSFLLDGKSQTMMTNLFIALGIEMHDRNFWFLSYLLLWYSAFYIIHHYNIQHQKRILILLLLSFIILSSELFMENFRLNVFGFPMGVAFSLYSRQIVNLYHNHKNFLFSVFLPLLFILSLLLYFAGNHIINKHALPYHSVYATLTAFVCMAGLFVIICYNQFRGTNKLRPVFFLIFFILLSLTVIAPGYMSFSISSAFATIFTVFLLKNISLNRISVFFEYIGTISLELFFLHGFFMYSYDFILYKFPLQYSFFVYLLLIVILSDLLNRLFRNIAKGFIRLTEFETDKTAR